MNVMSVRRGREDPSREQQYALTLANMHYLAETFKYALQKRTHLGDDDYVDIRKQVQDMLSLHFASDTFSNIDPERAKKPVDYMRGVVPQSDKGTSNIILYSPSGDTLVISSTLHNTFGCMRMSRQTGVLLNNALSDFSDLDVATRVVDLSGSDKSEVSESDARHANSMAPFKRPLTSLSPILVLGPKDSLLALAAAGDLRIPTSLSQKQLVMVATLLSVVSLCFGRALPMMFHYDPLIAEESQPQEQRQQSSIAPFVVTAPVTQQGNEGQQGSSDKGQELPAPAVRHRPQYSGLPAGQPAKRHAYQDPVVPQSTVYQQSPASAQASYEPAGSEQHGDLQGSATGYGHQAEGYLDMGAYSSGYGAFGWYADYPVGGGYH